MQCSTRHIAGAWALVAVFTSGLPVPADSPPGAPAATYRNPLIARHLADPFVLTVDGVHYLYATGHAEDRRRIPIYRSRDLVNWEFVRGAVEPGAPGAWNRRNFWAPEVMALDGKYHLYYTASTEETPENTGNRIGLAVAGSPEGPFEDRGVVVPDAALDGHPFRDADGTLYLFYVTEHGRTDGRAAGQIYVDRLTAPDRLEGKPVKLVGHHPWQEGPHLLRRDGIYHLTYSTGNWKDDSYAVRWATGRSPAGPFAEQPAPLLATTAEVKGPGHHAFFAAGGRDWIVYHGWDPAFTARYPRLDPLVVKDGRLSTPGPTTTPQPFER